MYRLQFLAVCLLGYCGFGATGPASFIKPCKPDDKVCQKASFTAAIPHFVKGIEELGIPPADPIVVKDVRADDKDLKLGFRNMNVAGVSKCQIKDFTRDVEKSTITLVVECPITATGQYDLSGKLWLLPAEGDGDFVIESGKVRITVILNLKVNEKEGVKYWKISGFDYSYDILQKPSIKLHNLYGGDEVKAKPIQDILESNPTELIKELGGPIIKELLAGQVNNVNKMFKAVPLSELELS